MEFSLNAALKTADAHRICSAIDAAIHTKNNLSQLAQKAGLDRVSLYRAFLTTKGPTLDFVVRALDALDFQFVVQVERELPETPANRHPLLKSVFRPELRSNSNAAEYLTRAFETCEIKLIVEAFSDTLRAQENVTQLAKRTSRGRTSLYRAFTAPHVPRFSTILVFLDALGLRLAIRPRTALQAGPKLHGQKA
jgi:probable addiction module antidote protein